MKKILLLIAFVFVSSSTIADELSHRKSAEELILLSNPEKLLEQVWAQVGDMVEQQFQQIGAPDELRPIIAKYTKKMFEVMQEDLSFESMKDDLIKIYVSTYTENEIRDIIIFYKSPAGKAFLDKMPKLVQESMDINQRKMGKMMEKINLISNEMVAEIEQFQKNNQ